MNKTVIVRTHDPVSGVRGNIVEPKDAPQGVQILQALKKMKPKDAVEATWTGGSNVDVRPLPRSTKAAIRIAADLLRDGVLEPKQALARVQMKQFIQLLTRAIGNVDQLTKLGSGLAAAPGAVAGTVATTAAEAIELATAKVPVILYVEKTTPDDMTAMKLVKGIITRTGGYTSHSAVVARQFGKPCIVSYNAEAITGIKLQGDVTLDGSNGVVYAGTAEFVEPTLDEHMDFLLSQADKAAKLQVFANADTKEDFQKALAHGAKGLGLCRTEHTFFSESGIAAILKYIFAKSVKAKSVAVQAVYEAQLQHFTTLFQAGIDKEYTVRLLDPPLHEFLPDAHDKDAVKKTSKLLKVSQKDLISRIKQLHEENPMLGHRGCRLGITDPSIYGMQMRALFRAARAENFMGTLNVMIPLVASVREARELYSLFIDCKSLFDNPYIKAAKFGVMLETPRACLMSYELAEFCDFFSFGTNDLTQAVWMLSRDDSMSFLPKYIEKDIEQDPFQSLDMDGVGRLMAIAVESLGDRRAKVKVGICGEHGGDPRSIAFCHALGLDYVSCSPPRVLAARIAAAHANASPADGFVTTKVELPELANTNLSSKVVAAKHKPQVSSPLQGVPTIGSGSTSKGIGVHKPFKGKPSIDEVSGAEVAAQFMEAFGKNIGLKIKPLKPKPSLQEAVPPAYSGELGSGVPGWIKNAKPANKADVANMKKNPGAQAVKIVAGFRVAISGEKKHPASGVVVGYVEAPFLMMYVLGVNDPLGHDGKNMKALIKYEINTNEKCPLWLATPDNIAPMDDAP